MYVYPEAAFVKATHPNLQIITQLVDGNDLDNGTITPLKVEHVLSTNFSSAGDVWSCIQSIRRQPKI